MARDRLFTWLVPTLPLESPSNKYSREGLSSGGLQETLDGLDKDGILGLRFRLSDNILRCVPPCARRLNTSPSHRHSTIWTIGDLSGGFVPEGSHLFDIQSGMIVVVLTAWQCI
jgi:hypothetical protein